METEVTGQEQQEDKQAEASVDAEQESTTEAEAEAGKEETDNVESLDAKKEESSQDEFKDKYYYVLAEMQNAQKRFDREKQNLLKYGSEKILKDMLDVLDNFERTANALRADQDEKMKNVVIGIEMISKQFVDALSKHGLKEVKALGEVFDPNFHEALAQQKAEGKKEMEIIAVHQSGYTLNERLLRAAKVVVVKNED